MMGGNSTLDTNDERRAKLDIFFKGLWEDGSFVGWVNPKTQRLNVKKVANEYLGINDTTIFSKWAQSYRDDFNHRYGEWRLATGELVSQCDETRQFPSPRELVAPDAFLGDFMKSNVVADLDAIDKHTLMILLKSYQDLFSKGLLINIEKLHDTVRKLEAKVIGKDRKLVQQAEAIEYLKKVRVIEEVHFMRSIRNLYAYDMDYGSAEVEP